MIKPLLDLDNPLTHLPVTTIQAWDTRAKVFREVLVDGDYDGEYFAQFYWMLNPGGYVMRSHYEYTTKPSGERTRGHKIMHYLHQEVLPPKPGFWIIFKNGNKLDVRSANLAYITPTENSLTRKQVVYARNSPSSSQYRGVQYRPGKKDWIASVSGRFVGIRNTEAAAAALRDQAAKKRWGDKAILNFPPLPGKNYCRKCYQPVDQPAVYHQACLPD